MKKSFRNISLLKTTGIVICLLYIFPSYSYPHGKYWNNIKLEGNRAERHEKAENIFLDFAKMLQQLPLDSGKIQIQLMFNDWNRNNKHDINLLSSLCEDILGDPDSPFYNDELYITSLEETLKSETLKDDEKIRPQILLETALKNRVGSPAQDFPIYKRNGERISLYSIESPYLILFFNDPDCNSCEKAKTILSADTTLSSMLSQKMVVILGVYPFGDMELWIDGCDEKQLIMENSWYDLRTSPTLFLLDKNKKVIIKNGSPENIISYLKKHIPKNLNLENFAILDIYKGNI